jgi:hypothetical protein
MDACDWLRLVEQDIVRTCGVNGKTYGTSCTAGLHQRLTVACCKECPCNEMHLHAALLKSLLVFVAVVAPIGPT